MRRLHRSRGLIGVVAVTIALLVGACGDDDGAGTTSSTSSSTTTTEETTTTTKAPTTTTTPPLPAPTHVVARAGAGSGEVELEWSAVPGATGYRVLRATSESGSFAMVAEIDVRTGATTTKPGVTNLWSSHSYLPDRGPLTAPDESDTFRLVNTEFEERCFQVVALRGSAAGTPSPTVCGSPP